MTSLDRGAGDGAGPPRRDLSTDVLADRIAAAMVHHEPGWRLPRLTALARRYHVSTAEIEAAIDHLATRHLLRRLPDGQVYRASPAEYQVPLAGLSGLTSYVDPMGGRLACKSRQLFRRRPPEGIGRSLRLAPGELVLAVRCLWTVGGEPGALSASYLPERLAAEFPEFAADSPAVPPVPVVPPVAAVPAGGGHPQALQIELGPPPPSVGRALRLSAGELVATVTVSFEDPAARSPVALTVSMLRPDLFRIVVQAAAAPVPAGSMDGFASAWTHAATGWEP